ncbi:hypothetical protein HY798_03750 [Candidatus Falkowbacteria bacterium]|nr:hypothetical protein [Candidatus Falkowbacteria bacterium]
MEEKNNYFLYRGLVPRILTNTTHDEAVEVAKKEYREHGEKNNIELYKKTVLGTEQVLKWSARANEE